MSIVSIIVFLGILVAVNYLGTRQSKRWDLTANQVYSLSDQTIKILKELKESKELIVFIDESGLSERPTRVRTWAPKGKTPIIQFHFNWTHISVIAGLVMVGDCEGSPAGARSSALASPKSSTFTVPSGRSLMLAGFRSRWMIPRSWAASNASAI